MDGGEVWQLQQLKDAGGEAHGQQAHPALEGRRRQLGAALVEVVLLSQLPVAPRKGARLHRRRRCSRSRRRRRSLLACRCPARGRLLLL